MIIGVPKEIKLQEHRIGLTPDSVKALTDKNHEVLIENNGGFEAGFTNDDYLKVGAKIIKTPTVLLGTGESISGRIILESGYSPAENLIFYGSETLTTGWSLISSKVGEEVTLVYSKSGRFATIYIAPRGTLTGFFVGDSGSDIDISVVHPDAIAIQNPYEGLNYDSLPELP